MLKLPMVAGVIMLAAFPIDNGNVSARSQTDDTQENMQFVPTDKISKVIDNIGYILAAIDTYSAYCDNRPAVTASKYFEESYYSLLSTYDWGDFVKVKSNQLDARTKKGVFFGLIEGSYKNNLFTLKSSYSIAEGCKNILLSAQTKSDEIAKIKTLSSEEYQPFKTFVKENIIVKNGPTYSAALPKLDLPMTVESINKVFPTDQSLENYVEIANKVRDSSLQTLVLTKVFYEAYKYPKDNAKRNATIAKIIEQQPKVVESILTPISATYTDAFFKSNECVQLLGDYCTLGKQGGIIPISSSTSGTKYIVLQSK